MSKSKSEFIPFTPEEGFDLSFLTVKKVAVAAHTSDHAVRDNVVVLLKALPVEDRIPVLEHMLTAKEKNKRKIEARLAKGIYDREAW